MIPANELRIGNWVDVENASTIIDNSSGAYQKIVRAKYEQVESISNEFALAGGFHCLEYGEPIPLTPEIIVACGFTPKKALYETLEIKYKTGLIEAKISLENTDDGEWRWIDGNTNVALYSLHQLQNLYFALTGTELTIDESKLNNKTDK